ncbi:MAG: stage II sporulation protein M [Syntrophomonadaceae bacterium]|nr:stage II sporulation protein M [Syntrophomonadaceae bacterium]
MAKLNRLVKGFLQEHFRLLGLVLLFFLLGAILGGLSGNHLPLEQQQELKSFIDQNCQALINEPFDRTRILGQTLTENVCLAFSLWFLGLTVIGLPLVIVIIFIRGFILGFTVGFLVQQKSLQGTALILLGILPHSLIYVPALIVGGVLAISFTLFLIQGRFSVTSMLWSRFLHYTWCMLGVVLVLLLSGLLEGLVVPAFLRLLVPLLGAGG